MYDFAKAENVRRKRTSTRGGPMKKIFKPLVFAICLVVVFAIGYSVGPGSEIETVADNSQELLRMQNKLKQKNSQLVNMQQSLNLLKKEQDNLREDLKASKEATATAESNVDSYASNTKVGDLTFYNNLQKQDVNPAPLQADPARLAAAGKAADPYASSKLVAIPKNGGKKVASAAGTSSKPLRSGQALKANKATAAKQASLPKRYIPPGFNSATKTSANGAYMVQMASYKTDKASTGLRKKIGSYGFNHIIKKVTIASGTRYRVMVGPYQSYSQAKSAKSVLQQKVGIDGLIVKTRK